MSTLSAYVGPAETKITTYFGRAADDLPEDSTELKVIIPQLTPAASGAVESASGEASITTESIRGKTETVSAETTNTITASFLGESNRKYPPSVRRGEQVQVIQLGDSDIYYWKSLGRDPELRQLEVWRIEVSDKTALNEPLTDENTYYIELNTRTSALTMKTATYNGEKARYFFQMNGKLGTFNLNDNIGNLIKIDSLKHRITLANKDGSMLDLFGKNAILAGIDDVILKSGRQVVLDTPCLTSQTSKGGGVTVMDVNGMSISAKNSIVFNAPAVGVNGTLKVSESVMAGGMVQSAGYSVGPVGPGYPSSTVDMASGSGEAAAPPPGGAAAQAGARHAAAYEQMLEMATAVESMMGEISGALGVPAVYTGVLTSIATDSKMSSNQGT